MDQDLSGFIPLGTTGESPAIEDDEVDAIVELTTRIVGDPAPAN
jgi:dihydrodipicolinate synthase/N-acetylneuraminate lyase